jgi:hypothetical protein
MRPETPLAVENGVRGFSSEELFESANNPFYMKKAGTTVRRLEPRSKPAPA